MFRCRQQRPDVAAAAKRGKRSQGSSQSGSSKGAGTRGPGLLQVEPDGSDVWRLESAVDSIQSGGVGRVWR